MDLSIVIVNHNTKELTEQTVRSVFDTTEDIDYEIIVADNSSDSSEFFLMDDSRVRIIHNVENKGFGNACNIGARLAVGRYVLFLNSDTVMQRGSLQNAVKFMDSDATIGCLGIKTVLKDGSFDHGCKRGFPTPFNSLCYVLRLDKIFKNSKKMGGYRLSYLDIDETNDVDSVSGAFMLIPADLYDKTGGFDETIFMYGEDIDLCYRIKTMGYRVVYYAGAWMVHLKGQSGLHTKNSLVIYHFHKGIRDFYDKYYKDKYCGFVTFLMHSAINIRYAVTLIYSKITK